LKDVNVASPEMRDAISTVRADLPAVKEQSIKVQHDRPTDHFGGGVVTVRRRPT
jgi:hypothetical protein